jgi:hypothetical protein
MTATITGESRSSPAVAALLLLAVGYNFLLALFNASIHPVGASSAYAVELASMPAASCSACARWVATVSCWCSLAWAWYWPSTCCASWKPGAST